MVEYADIIMQMSANPNIKNPSIIGGPSLCDCNTGWANSDLIDNHGWLKRCKRAFIERGFGLLIQDFIVRDNINALHVVHYPTDNCAIEGDRRPVEEIEAETILRFGQFSHHNGTAMSVKNFASR